jgi:hypothetical protein
VQADLLPFKRMADKSKSITPSGVAKRHGRKGLRRSKTLNARRLSKDEVAETDEIIAASSHVRPAHRGHCANGPRPCPWVACKFHLYLDVNPETGTIKLNFPDLEPWEMKETCALDVADRGGITLEEVGEILNLTRERIRQVEVFGLEKLKIEYTDLLGDD